MATFFEIAILKMQALGFFSFLLPFMLTSAITYGILRKSQLFGEPEKNVTVNAIISLVFSLFVWAAPVILGINIETPLATFFVQGLSVFLVGMIAMMLVGMVFQPDLPKNLSEKLKGPALAGGLAAIGLIAGIIIMITSGLGGIFFPRGIQIPSDILISVGVIILLGGTVALIVLATGKNGK
ncbi:MAG: hypothetical protein HYW23_03830 [Candidatus Aenigmarchaeota archaeon]|nr:hypothetical protein [Candidatus Aenigmarchaeota archaeon]